MFPDDISKQEIIDILAIALLEIELRKVSLDIMQKHIASANKDWDENTTEGIVFKQIQVLLSKSKLRDITGSTGWKAILDKDQQWEDCIKEATAFLTKKYGH